jgi:hypothetical protein
MVTIDMNPRIQIILILTALCVSDQAAVAQTMGASARAAGVTGVTGVSGANLGRATGVSAIPALSPSALTLSSVLAAPSVSPIAVQANVPAPAALERYRRLLADEKSMTDYLDPGSEANRVAGYPDEVVDAMLKDLSKVRGEKRRMEKAHPELAYWAKGPIGRGWARLTDRAPINNEAALGALFDGSTPMVKPAVDWWEVGGRRYESTAALVRALPRLGKSREATYYYRHKNAVDSSERRFNTVAGGVSAGLFGIAGGALLWTLGMVVGPFIGLVSGLTASAAPDLFLISGFFGAVLGFVGLVAGAMEGGKPSSEAVTGRLHVSGKSLRFLFKGDEAGSKPRAVNLNAYASARTPSAAPAPAPQSLLKGALKGLGMGLAVAVSLMIPLVQVVTIPLMGPGVGMDIGRRLSLRGHAVGGLLGGALGLLVPLSFFAALALGGAQNIALMAVWAGALGLVGAVLGVLLNNPLNRADAWAKVYAPKGQWWNSAP